MYEQSYNTAVQSLATEQMGQKRRDEHKDGVVRITYSITKPLRR